MNKYILVEWPESQYLMDKPWFNECLLLNPDEPNGIGSSCYMVPEHLYNMLEI